MAVLTSLRLPRPSAGPAQISSVAIRGNRCEHNGQVSAVLATSDLDIEALDPARKAAASASFARMCHTLQSPMQLLVRVRRLAALDAPAGGGPHPDLDAAMYGHWTEQIQGGNRHTRQVLVALVASTPAALDTACAHATDRLAALGVTATRLESEDLAAAVTDGFDTNVHLVRVSEVRSRRRRHGVRPRAAPPSGPSGRGGMACATAQRADRVRHRRAPGSGVTR